MLLLVLAPTADVAAFGLHEHVVVTPEPGSDLTGPNGLESVTLAHHCELSVSFGEAVPIVELPTPMLVEIGSRELRVSSPQHRPFVLLTPPRA